MQRRRGSGQLAKGRRTTRPKARKAPTALGSATLRLSTTSDLPKRLYVEIDGYRRRCRIIWRKDKEIGIGFD